MEVETHGPLSTFELNQQPPPPPSSSHLPFSYLTHHSELRASLGYRSPCMSAAAAPAPAPPECDQNVVGSGDVMASVSIQDVASPAASMSPGVHDSGYAPSCAAMTLQKIYRSYRTRRMLADSAVVAEELWWQALDYARLNHNTISFFNFSKPESAASRWNRVRQNASKVGKGLSKDGKAQQLAFQHWIEAIDPRHRYGHGLHIYYKEWCKGDAGQPFFYWLDLGDGRELDLEEYPRSKLRQQCIKYLGPQEREHYEYIVKEGKIVHKQTGNFLDTTKGLPGAKWIFVVSTSEKLYVGEKKKGAFHHSSFLAGGATLAAGRLVVEDGVLKSISPYSGHYRPTEDRLECFLSFLKENGVNLDEVEVKKANEDCEKHKDRKSSKGSFLSSSSAKYENGDRNSTNDDTSEVSTFLDSPQPSFPNEEDKDLPSDQTEVPKSKSEIVYKRTLSGGLQIPKTQVPKTVILQRINSKKAAKSYQLGNQLSLKWSTGYGPRIGCIADYPKEVRLQALELTQLSPRLTQLSPRRCRAPTPSRIATLLSPTKCSSPDLSNGDLTFF